MMCWMTQTEHWCGNTFINTDDADSLWKQNVICSEVIIWDDFVVPSHHEIFKLHNSAVDISVVTVENIYNIMNQG
jgi:hypothetical protein